MLFEIGAAEAFEARRRARCARGQRVEVPGVDEDTASGLGESDGRGTLETGQRRCGEHAVGGECLQCAFTRPGRDERDGGRPAVEGEAHRSDQPLVLRVMRHERWAHEHEHPDVDVMGDQRLGSVGDPLERDALVDAIERVWIGGLEAERDLQPGTGTGTLERVAQAPGRITDK